MSISPKIRPTDKSKAEDNLSLKRGKAKGIVPLSARTAVPGRFSVVAQILLQPLHWIACCWVFTLYILLFYDGVFSSTLRGLLVVYLVWITFFARHRGYGKVTHWFREYVHGRGSCWTLAAGYFPITCYKCAELGRTAPPPGGAVRPNSGEKKPVPPHLFVTHPHGIFGIATQAVLATNACRLDELYPTLYKNIRMVGLGALFQVPFAREYWLLAGCIASSRGNMEAVFKANGHCVLNVGGAAESILLQQPKKLKILLKDRKGFVRLGLRSGCVLVPCVSFEEWDLFHQYNPPKDSLFEKMQQRFQKIAGFALPLFFGDLFFFPLIPRRKPAALYIGGGLQLPKIESPSEVDVDEWHGRYCVWLTEHFDRWKTHAGRGDWELEIVGDPWREQSSTCTGSPTVSSRPT